MKDIFIAFRNWIIGKLHVCQFEDIDQIKTNYVGRNPKHIYKITETYIQKCKKCSKIRSYTVVVSEDNSINHF